MKTKQVKAYVNILLYIIIFLVGNMLFYLIAAGIVSNIYDIAFNDFIKAMANDTSLEFLKPKNLTLSIATSLTYIILFGAIVIYNFKDLKEALKSFKLKHFIWLALGFGVLYGGSYLINYLISLAGVGVSENQNSIVDMVKHGSAALVGISVIICAPLAEEMIFRKSIGDLTLEKSKVLYYLIAVLAFALPHMLSTKASALDFMLMSIPYLFSGLALAFLYERTNNIYVTIGAHILNNLVAFILLFV